MSRARSVSLALASAEGVVAGYLTWAHGRGEAPACLAGSGGGGCATVADSRYAEIAGVPVAALGLAGALALVGLALTPGAGARALAGALALGGFLFSAYLTAISLLVIEAMCQWCLASFSLWGAMALHEGWRWRAAVRQNGGADDEGASSPPSDARKA